MTAADNINSETLKSPGRVPIFPSGCVAPVAKTPVLAESTIEPKIKPRIAPIGPPTAQPNPKPRILLIKAIDQFFCKDKKFGHSDYYAQSDRWIRNVKRDQEWIFSLNGRPYSSTILMPSSSSLSKMGE